MIELSSELRTDLERHAAWLDGLHLGIGKELMTWLVECPHYAALWKEQVDENAWLRAVALAGAPDGRVAAGAGDPHTSKRGEPSDAQMRAALGAWPNECPLPNEDELQAIVRAVNRAPWPDVLTVQAGDPPIQRRDAMTMRVMIKNADETGRLAVVLVEERGALEHDWKYLDRVYLKQSEERAFFIHAASRLTVTEDPSATVARP